MPSRNVDLNTGSHIGSSFWDLFRYAPQSLWKVKILNRNGYKHAVKRHLLTKRIIWSSTTTTTVYQHLVWTWSADNTIRRNYYPQSTTYLSTTLTRCRRCCVLKISASPASARARGHDESPEVTARPWQLPRGTARLGEVLLLIVAPSEPF